MVGSSDRAYSCTATSHASKWRRGSSCSVTGRVKSEVCGDEKDDIAQGVARESGRARAGMSVKPSGG